ncbi:glycosyltransferase family 4 protein, partial [Avibacterium avium]|uniref:glycosyltransferase family 4 protein n=1 Tax=Avibacterium avium TaxID=751 RepID=UPI003BF91FB4
LLSLFKNRYLLFFISFLNFFYLNIVYFFYAYCLLRAGKGTVVIYSSVLFSPAAFFIKLLSRRKVKVISRMYGVFITRNLESIKNRLACYQELLSFKFNFDLYVITNDGTQGDKAARYFGVDEDKIIFIVNGVDDAALNSLSVFEPNKVNLFAASRFVIWKKVDRIILAFNKVKSENVGLKIAGDGDCFDKYKNLSNSRAEFLGMIKNDDVLSYIQKCDIFISMYDVSNIGNPLLQALYFGKPIITYDSGATKEFLREFENNIIIIPRSDNEEEIILNLVNAIEYLVSNPNEMFRMSEGIKKISHKVIKKWDERIQVELDAINELFN